MDSALAGRHCQYREDHVTESSRIGDVIVDNVWSLPNRSLATKLCVLFDLYLTLRMYDLVEVHTDE